MKKYTITCDLCNKKIDWQNDKYHTMEAPGMIDFKKGEVVKIEYHFCTDHDHFSIINSLMSYELHLIKKFNDYLRDNRWNPEQTYD